MTRPLTVALPKGRMADTSLELLNRAGYEMAAENGSRKLVVPDARHQLRYILAKPGDVGVYVEHGAADLGIAGIETLRETEPDVYEPLLLPFGRCRLVVAGPAERATRPFRLEPHLRVATKYPRLTHSFFAGRGVSPEIIGLTGSVELAPLVGLADVIVDLVETGNTLRANGLVELRTILHSQACLIANRASYRVQAEAISRFIEAVRAVVDMDDGR